MNTERVTYPGFALQDDAEGLTVTGRISFTGQQLHFESDTDSFALLLSELSLDLDGSGRVWFGAEEGTGWRVGTFEQRVLDDYFVQHQTHLRAQARDFKQRREGGRTLKFAATFLLIFAVVVLGIWLCGKGITAVVVRNAPVSWEESLGDAAAREVLSEMPLADDQAPAAVLSNLVQRLGAALPEKRYRFRVELIEHPIPNAMALPGGRIFVCTGLLDMKPTPEEVAGVLAHEMVHVTQRHGLRQVVATVGPYYVLRVFVSDRQGLLAVLSQGSELLVRQQYSRGLEQEADLKAWRLLTAANLDPRGLASFLRREAEQPLSKFSERTIPRVLSSHPATDQRLAELDALWEKSSKKSGFDTLPALPAIGK